MRTFATLSLVFLLAGGCGVSKSDGGFADASVNCSQGEQRCLAGEFDVEFQTCSADGTFEQADVCSDGCNVSTGCIVPVDVCKAGQGGDGVGECDMQAPPDAFEPEVQWSWSGFGGDVQSIVTPLVGNLTDDNDDGVVDLCDTPDVVVVAGVTVFNQGHIYLLDGESGTMHFQVAETVDMQATPAIADIDGDGIMEIITTSAGSLIAFENDGSLKWRGPLVADAIGDAVAVADVDNDGDAEILIASSLFDHEGTLIWQKAGAPSYSASTMADLDGDGDLEIVLGKSAYHHTGDVFYNNQQVAAGYPQIANLDSDPEPEILITNPNGLTLLNHDGTAIFENLRPTGAPAGGLTWIRPATIHDFDGDDVAEFAMSSGGDYTVYEADGSITWSAEVLDSTGIAAGTAFDFLGDGTAEAMYADETSFFIFDSLGNVLLEIPRASRTVTEYPVVADIDNDGSAEVVVVSNETLGSVANSPTVQVVRDVQDRWVQARRIWNQHTYHVTNVREDGTIPQQEEPSWQTLNTFRTNAQLANGQICDPDHID